MIRRDLYTPKFGLQTLLLDESDANFYKDTHVMMWSSKRHHTIYAMITHPATKKAARLHRLIMDAKPGEVVDHINGNGLDNRRANLRLTTQKGNNKNANKRKNARTSEYKGVHFCSKMQKWKAQIQVDKKKVYLGAHLTELEAAKAYNKAAIIHHKEFANLNNIKEKL